MLCDFFLRKIKWNEYSALTWFYTYHCQKNDVIKWFNETNFSRAVLIIDIKHIYKLNGIYVQ